MNVHNKSRNTCVNTRRNNSERILAYHREHHRLNSEKGKKTNTRGKNVAVGKLDICVLETGMRNRKDITRA